MIQLTKNSWIKTIPAAVDLTKEEFDEIWKNRPTTKHKIKIFGKEHEVPRIQVLYADEPTGDESPISYKFSGNTLHAITPMPEYITRCMDFVKGCSPEYEWNGALVNFYEDGSNYIGKHSDDESDLTPGAPIYSFSFGGVRKFRIRKKGTKGFTDFNTENCSCIVMGGKMQEEYTHEIVKTKKHVDPRINVTIRAFRTAS